MLCARVVAGRGGQGTGPDIALPDSGSGWRGTLSAWLITTASYSGVGGASVDATGCPGQQEGGHIHPLSATDQEMARNRLVHVSPRLVPAALLEQLEAGSFGIRPLTP